MSIIYKDKTVVNTISGGILAGLTAGTGAIYGKLKTYEAKLQADPTVDYRTIKLQVSKAKQFLIELASITTSFTTYYFLNEEKKKPAAVIAGFPIGTVHELSHSISDLTVKYRATGGVFLAHQDGGSQSLRVVLQAFGINRYQFLNMLDLIFLYGQGKMVDLFNLRREPIPFQTEITKTPWLEFDKNEIDEGGEEAHLTFPIITRNRVYTSMYLETYDVVESIDNGMNLLNISLFFRKYIPSRPVLMSYIAELKSGETPPATYGEAVKPELKDEWEESPLLWYKQENEILALKLLSVLDMALDIGLSLIIYLNQLATVYDPEITAYSEEQILALTFAQNISPDRPQGKFSFDKFNPITYIYKTLGVV